MSTLATRLGAKIPDIKFILVISMDWRKTHGKDGLIMDCLFFVPWYWVLTLLDKIATCNITSFGWNIWDICCEVNVVVLIMSLNILRTTFILCWRFFYSPLKKRHFWSSLLQLFRYIAFFHSIICTSTKYYYVLYPKCKADNFDKISPLTLWWFLDYCCLMFSFSSISITLLVIVEFVVPHMFYAMAFIINFHHSAFLASSIVIFNTGFLG